MTATAATATSVSTIGPAPGAIRPLAWFALLAYGWTWGVGLLIALLLRAGGISESVTVQQSGSADEPRR